MIREERTVFLTILTFVLYSFIQLWEKGTFIFPFPLNEIAVFIVFLYFVYLNKKKLDVIWMAVGLVCFFKLLSHQFIWSIFLPNEKLELLFTGIMTDILYLLYSISFIVFTILYTKSIENKNLLFTRIGILIIFSLGVLINQPILEVLSFFILYFISWKANLNQIFRSLICLILVLDTGKFLMSLF